jgi:hypothetical protein
MSLPACQQRTLDRIDTALRVREPRLASMFAIFTRLAADEETPWWERLRAPRWPGGRLRAVVVSKAPLVAGQPGCTPAPSRSNGTSTVSPSR